MTVGRRHFLIGVGVVATGSAVGIQLVPRLLAGQSSPPVDFKPHAFVRLSSDDTVTVIIGKSEMGQGVYTGLPMILAEELDFDPQRIKVEIAGVDPAFNHPFIPAQFTGGSMSTPSTYESLRQVGATARSMLVTAAAQYWKVDAATLRTDDGHVVDARGRRLRYGSLLEAASELPVPAKDTLKMKDRSEFRYIGRPQKRLGEGRRLSGVRYRYRPARSARRGGGPGAGIRGSGTLVRCLRRPRDRRRCRYQAGAERHRGDRAAYPCGIQRPQGAAHRLGHAR
jgi:isoquinoline 1-oxidoreductase beta subunit